MFSIGYQPDERLPSMFYNIAIILSNLSFLKAIECLHTRITDTNSTAALDNLLPPERTMVTLVRKRRHNCLLEPNVSREFL